MDKGKKYYWLKFKNDFFAQKEIKKLRRIAGGDTFTIIYLKMQLKSLENDGKLFFEGFEDNFADELALDLDEDADNIKITLLYMEKHGLIEKAENSIMDEYFLPAVKENTGSETAVAGRVRRHRERKLLLCNANELQSNTHETPMKQNVNVEKEIEKELDIDIEKKRERDKFFDSIWDLYDKKVGKKDAIKSINKINQSEYGNIINHIQQYVKVTDKKFRKNLSTYLNKESWNDEVIDYRPKIIDEPYTESADEICKRLGYGGSR